MKIDQELRTTIGKNQKGLENRQVSQANFNEMVQKSDQKLQLDELNRLMVNIEDAGAKLARSRTLQDLAKYKKLVKSFVHEAVEYGLHLKHTRSFNGNGRSRQLTVIQKVDEHLLELTKDVMEQEKNSIDILGKIGEIKGLLINLYM